MLDWIGTGQSNSLPFPFEVRIRSQEKNWGLEACCLTSVFTELPFQSLTRLIIQALLGSIMSYYKLL